MKITITIQSTPAIDRDEDELRLVLHQASGAVNDFELSELDGFELRDTEGLICGKISVEDDEEGAVAA